MKVELFSTWNFDMTTTTGSPVVTILFDDGTYRAMKLKEAEVDAIIDYLTQFKNKRLANNPQE